MKQQTFFNLENVNQPLADRLRPKNLDEFVGQEHLLGKGKILRNLIESDRVSSMIFWGPPGVGKTTLAKIVANRTKSSFIEFSAVNGGIKEIREIMRDADSKRFYGEKTIVFVDEIHRFNKAQQDAFLPFVEKGSITLIGATTENPSFEVNGALLSRCKVFVLKQLGTQELAILLRKAIEDPRGFGDRKVIIADNLIDAIAGFADGDARSALSTLEMVILNGEIRSDENIETQEGVEINRDSMTGGTIRVTEETVKQCISVKSLLYDKNGEEHYNLISALHKSMRNSDPDAAVYWLARMLEAGEDPMYIARRVTRFASEDIGIADSKALEVAVAAFQACHLIGMPECSVNLTHAVVYCALSPKSNSMYTAYTEAKSDALKSLAEPVPSQIRNAPTKLMKDLGYGKGYLYAHNYEERLTTLECLPDSLKGKEYYHPGEQGFEAKYKERYEQIKDWKKKYRK